MPVHRSGTPRRPRLAAAGTLLAALALLLTLPGAATAAPADDSPARGTARLGQGVIEHDGQGGLPRDSRSPRPRGSTSAATRATWTGGPCGTAA